MSVPGADGDNVPVTDGLFAAPAPGNDADFPAHTAESAVGFHG
jgi:hypothetical protein